MKRKRFRKVSLRLALFVLMPLCAIAFFVGSRVMHANKQLRIMQSLEDQGITNRWSNVSYGNDTLWWQAFWGDNPALSVEHAVIWGKPDELKAIEPLTNLRSLTLNHPPGDLTAARIREVINEHPKLEGFTVEGSPSAEVWKEISQTPKLKELIVLPSNNFSDNVLGHFVRRRLTELTLPNCPYLTDTGIQLIAKISSLKRLDVSGARITDQPLSALKDLPALEWLSLAKTRVTGSGLSAFGKGSRLKYLDLAHCPLDAETFTHIAGFSRLQTLYLHGTPVTDQQLAQLTHLTELNTISLDGTKITDEVMKQLVKFPALESLSLDDTQVSDDAIGRLAALKKLRSLSCNRTYVSPHALNQLGDSITHDRYARLTINWQGAACIDTSNGQVVGYIPSFPDSISNKNAVATSSVFDPVTVFSLWPGQPIHFLKDAYPPLLEISTDGSQFVTLSAGRMPVYKFPSGRRTRELFFGQHQSVKSIRLIGDQLVGIGPIVNCWHMKSRKLLWKGAPSIPEDGTIVARDNRLAIFDTQKIALMTARGDNVEFQLHQITPESSTIEFPLVLSVGFADDGSAVVAQARSWDGPLDIRNLESETTIATMPVAASVAVLSENAKVVATTDEKDSDIVIWDVATAQSVASVRIKHRGENMIFTPDGRYLIVEISSNPIKPQYR